ncbi:MAG: hypothetical protein ACTSPY_14905 [Candidatus Helarchaeota archaeon]
MDYKSKIYLTILEFNSLSYQELNIGYLWKKIKQNENISRDKFKTIIKELLINGDIKLEDGIIKVKSYSDLAEKAYKLEPSNITIFKYLKWQDFELLCKKILELNEFECISNFRFKTEGKRGRHEIDILAYRTPYLLTIDCKKWWMRNKISALKKAALDQIHRTKIMLKNVIEQNLFPFYNRSNKLLIYPLIITSLKEDIYSFSIPIIPFSKLNSFLRNFDFFQVESFYHLETYIG